MKKVVAIGFFALCATLSQVASAAPVWTTTARTVDHIEMADGGSVFVKMSAYDQVVTCQDQTVHKLAPADPERLELYSLLMLAHATRTPVKLLISDTCSGSNPTYQVIKSVLSEIAP